MRTQSQSSMNGFASGEGPRAQASNAPDELEIAAFLVSEALVRQCDASAFMGRKVCRITRGSTPLLAFADEVPVPDDVSSWTVSQEIAHLAQRQMAFMQGLGQTPERQTDSEGQAKTSTEIFAELLKRCSYEAQQDGRVVYQLDKTNIFVDHGSQLLMEPGADRNEEAILVALLLAKEKFGAIELTGDAEFQRRALEIIVRHDIDVRLKNAAQQALKDELIKARGAERAAKQNAQPSTAGRTSGAPRNGIEGSEYGSSRGPASEARGPKGHTSEATRCVNAYAWWQSQAAIISSSARSEREKEEQLRKLGPAPDKGKAWWFDAAGNPRPAPSDPTVERKLRAAAGMDVAAAATQTTAAPKKHAAGSSMRSTRFAR